MATTVEHADRGLLDGLRENVSWTIGIGVLLVVVGFLSLIAPLASGVAITFLVGVLLLAGGIGQLLLAFRAGAFGRGVLIFLVGAIAAVAGLLLIFEPIAGLASITLLLAAYFVATGILAIIAAFRLRPEAGWGWMLTNGIVTLVLGALIWRQWPLSGTWALGVLFGVQLIFAGAALWSIGAAVRRGLKHIAPSV